MADNVVLEGVLFVGGTVVGQRRAVGGVQQVRLAQSALGVQRGVLAVLRRGEIRIEPDTYRTTPVQMGQTPP
ncbi:hypothetical protein [Herbihabitans rhizosphaerae]|uniref:hypothetical protein n=1 Tax=Herbihabitans rhizosphaerae TaxID=1872711 RepID=UPI00102C9AFC|nr:hypothetical protein [Herbihabitans rhizosphaerae]